MIIVPYYFKFVNNDVTRFESFGKVLIFALQGDIISLLYMEKDFT